MRERNLEYLEEIFNQNKNFVYYFANKHPISYYEKDDYIQLLLLKFWDLIKKFKWEKYDNIDDVEKNRVFCRYAEKSLIRFLGELRDNYTKENQSAIILSLDANNDDENSFLELMCEFNDFDNKYYLQKLEKLKQENVINGYLIDYILYGNYNEIAKKYGLSRKIIKKEIEREIDILRKAI